MRSARALGTQIAFTLAALLSLAPAALASGPRFVTGPPFFTGRQGVPIGWQQTHLVYSTDPGSLGTSVSHAAADSLVAAAASVWNLPVANITLARGGTLAEHVSAQNTYLDASGMVFPSDVMSANAAAVPIAVLYDTDGSITDTLLGSGASDPSECRQDSVTSTVDSFDSAGFILHAIIVVNGRCSGPAPQLQLDLQYHLERAFGRVLGLAWSQTNDNVFTGSPAPTYTQALNWPIMHPLDIICGAYSYACLPSPFVLRPDDIASMVLLYPVSPNGTPPAGKQPSLLNALGISGQILFPTGEGMAGVNVLVRREQQYTSTPDSFFAASAVTGVLFRSAARSPFVAADNSAVGSFGSADRNQLGIFNLDYIPMFPANNWENLVISTEPVNPLYTGAYSLGQYAAGAVAPGGSPPAPETVNAFYSGSTGWLASTVADAPASCGNGVDGTASSPVAPAASGWWTGLLCGYGHASYFTLNLRPARTFTIEVTALDELGFATISKAMPVIGLFASTDDASALPSVAVAPVAFQALTFGTTTLSAQTPAQTAPQPGSGISMRLGIADQRGDGRPDFAYQSRVFYADNVVPAQIVPAGEQITITGSGFRSGNAVTVNGVAAKVLSWTANSIVLTAPAMAASHASANVAVDLVVSDRGTGASSTMSAALTYSGASTLPDSMRIVSAPSGSVYVGDTAPVPFAVQVIAPDGVTPVRREPIVFATLTGAAQFAACSATPCILLTDTNGIASTSVTPTLDGPIVLEAADGALAQNASFTAIAQAGRIQVIVGPSGDNPVNAATQPPIVLRVYAPNGGGGMPGRSVTFSVTQGAATFGTCSAAPCTAATDASGALVMSVTPIAVGHVTVQMTDGDLSETVTFNATSNTPTMKLGHAPNASQYVGSSAGVFRVDLVEADGITPDRDQSITFTAPPEVLLSPCSSSVCTVSGGYTGQAGVSVTSSVVGSYTITATFGSLTVTSPVVAFVDHTIAVTILSAPSGNLPIGSTSSVPFRAQLLQDGTIPLSNYEVTLSGPQGSVLLDNCGNHRAGCTFFTDANGIVSTPVTPVAAGIITLSATYFPNTVTASFTATGTAESMKIITQPGSTASYVGDNLNFAVQVIGPDGFTPAPNKFVFFNVTQGSMGLSSCSIAICVSVTDSNGIAYSSGIPTAPGTITVTAADSSSSASMTFAVRTHDDIMRLLTAPASGALPYAAAAVPFSVQVLYGDGVSLGAGKSVTLTVTNGSAAFAACHGAPTCVVAADVMGRISTLVTPLSAGPISISAVETDNPSVQQSATFNVLADLRPDILHLLSAPASGALINTAASLPFAVQVLHPDGSTPASAISVTVAVTNGSATLAACGGLPTCALTTDASGDMTTLVTPLAAGSITLTATEGSAQVSATFTAAAPVPKPDILRLVSAPASGTLVNTLANPPFAVQLLLADGTTPHSNQVVTVAVTNGTAALAGCNAVPCVLTTDASGTVVTAVTPAAAGAITLTATSGALQQSATFTAVAPAAEEDTLRLVSLPASGSLTKNVSASPFAVQLLLAATSAPDPNKSVTIVVTKGSATFGACGGASSCTLTTDSSGTIASSVIPQGAGTITLAASIASGAQVLAVFTAVAPAPKPDILRIISIPASGTVVDNPSASPFSAMLLLADGLTADSGQSVTIAVTNGAAVLSACGISHACVLTTSAAGYISTGVTPLAAGSITITATFGALQQSATFHAAPRPDILSLRTSPAASVYAGTTSATPLAVRVTLADGNTAVPGITILFGASTSNAIRFEGCAASPCTLVTDLDGIASTAVTGLIPGSFTLAATATLATGAQSVTSTFEVVANQLSIVPLGNTDVWIAEGAIADMTLAATASENSLAISAQLVQWSASPGFSLAASSSPTDASGVASMRSAIGPLVAATAATATACAWPAVCTTFRGSGVAASSFRVAFRSGATQSISGGSVFAAITALVSDPLGHPVIAAPVTIYQTVAAITMPCPPQGRCPAAPILRSQATVLTSDSDGTITFTPITVSGVATATHIVLSTGTQGVAYDTVNALP